MSKPEIDDFSDGSIAEIAKTVRTLRWQVQNVQELLKRLGRHRPTHEIRTGRMKARDGEQYPTKGCVLPVRFQDVGFEETVGKCDEITRAPWEGKFVSARAYDGRYIKEDTDVLIVKVAARQGRRWWIIPLDNTATIVFTLTTDRTRETEDGEPIGKADAIIKKKFGRTDKELGDTVEVVFGDMRWLGAVSGCQGIADFIVNEDGEETWLVKECQELSAGFWFTTTEDRTQGAPDQDVRVEVLPQQCGHANADYPPQAWGGHPRDENEEDPPECSGGSLWHWNPFAQPREWELVTDNCSEGCSPVPPESDPVDPDIATHATGGCSPTGQPPASAQNLKVRYLADTFPRMLKGAIGFATFDNDIFNASDNSTMFYYAVQSDQAALILSSALTSDMCGIDPDVTEGVVKSPWPFSQLPEDIQYKNLENHYGLAGDTFSAYWDETIGYYRIFDVKLHKVSMSQITKTTVDGCTTITDTPLEVAVEHCGKTGQATTILSYRTQTVTDVTGVRIDKAESGDGSGVTCDPKLIVDITQYEGYVVCDDPTPSSVEVSLETQTALIAFDADGCPMWTTVQLIVGGTCGDPVVHEADCDPCPSEGSGSG